MAITNITEGVIYRDGKFFIPVVYQHEDEESGDIEIRRMKSFRFDDGADSFNVDFDGTDWNFTDFKLIYHNAIGSITEISNVNIEWEGARFRVPDAIISFTFMDGESSYEYEWVVDEWVLSFFNYLINYTEQVTVGDIDPVGVTFSANVFTVPAENTEFTFTDDGMKYGYVNDNGFWNRYTQLVSYTQIATVGGATNGVTFESNVFTVPVGVKNFMFTDNGVEYFVYCNLLTWHIIETQVNDGADYVVALWGSDTNTGAFSQPFLTWQKAFNTADAGDTIHFRGGVYYRQQEDSVLTIYPTYHTPEQNSGTPGNIIEYFGSPTDVANGNPIIYDCIMYTPPGEAPTQGYNGALTINGLTDNTELQGTIGYMHFRDFTLRNILQRRAVIMCKGLSSMGCRDMKFERLVIYDVGGRGMYLDGYVGSGHNYIIDCDFYNCYDSMPYNYANYLIGRLGHDGTGLVAVVVDTAETEQSFLTVEGCRAWHCSKAGYAIGSGAKIITENTWAFLIGKDHTDFDGGSGNGYRMGAAWDYIQDQPDLVVHEVYNSISALCKQTGFYDISRFDSNQNLFNNIAYKSKIGFRSAHKGENPEGWVREQIYINNIGYNNEDRDNGYRIPLITTNSWSTPPGVTVADADFEVMPSDADVAAEMKAPRKADGSLPDLTVFRVDAASDLKGAGTDVGMSLAPDIGIDWAYLEE